MAKEPCVVVALLAAFSLSLPAGTAREPVRGDWPEVRGPHRDGISDETGLFDTWAIDGENFLWRAPYGGRSTPIVLGDRVYVQNPAGRGADLQERVMCLDANTGRVVWEHRFNVFQSDVPPHRVAWASPAADPETGNVYALGAGALVVALSTDGTPLWQRSVGEEFGAFTTHGGRTMSPLIDGDLVIVSAAVSNWGTLSNRAHRFIALDKRTGAIVWVATPGGRPYDTAYAPPLIATIKGMRLLIGGTGDGAVHALKPQTGEKVWSFVAAKRAINTAVAVKGDTVLVSHGDENLDTNVMGMVAAIDGSQTGDIKTTQWAVKGHEFGFSSPIVDGDRVYQIDNGSTLHAFALATGRELWALPLGTIQRASPVFADGKLYVGNDNGKFFVIRPYADRAEILSTVELPLSKDSLGGSEGTPEQVLAGAAVSRGRVFFMSSDAVYGLGPRKPRAVTGVALDAPAPPAAGPPAFLQVAPTEVVLRPGEAVTLRARLFDARGVFVREEKAAWTLEGLKGAIEGGVFTADAVQADQAGLIKATAAGVTGQARAKIARALPWSETFESYADGTSPPGWVNMAAGKFSVVTLEGRKVLQKAPDNTLYKRIRAFVGPVESANYTFEADVRATARRRQMGDVGITVQRYTLVLYGTHQQLKLEPWEPEIHRTAKTPYAWKPDTWYRLKLRVENGSKGAVRARGKVWPSADPEPAEWAIDKLDPIGNRQGPPGFFVDAEFGAYLANLKLTPNQ